jgi:hypothetical protein
VSASGGSVHRGGLLNTKTLIQIELPSVAGAAVKLLHISRPRLLSHQTYYKHQPGFMA